jgi:quercetin dioxygenase-like cupin family protein
MPASGGSSRREEAADPAAVSSQVLAAQVVLPCSNLEDTLVFFTGRLGFRVDNIAPADKPSMAVISGHGVRIRLEHTPHAPAGVVQLLCRDPSRVAGGRLEWTAPNGTRVELVAADPPPIVPPVRPSLVVSSRRGAQWSEGRAGMRYRDLVPDRQGGRFVASHIQIPDGGAVPDYVHFHKVRFQLIYCYRGWVRVVYEDQGPPFVMEAGDCVLQPPRIRHRVLECSPGLEVIEISCPAEHETVADHALALPTAALRPEREFEGQRFVRCRAATAVWQPWRLEGFECRDLGVANATGDLAGALVARCNGVSPSTMHRHHAELLLTFVLEGGLTLRCEGQPDLRLVAGDCFVVPAAMDYALTDCSPDTELLEAVSPAGFEAIPRA